MVEDEAAILELGQCMLVALGYTVLSASVPSQALQIVANHPAPIHLLFTDVVMPEMNGRDLAAKIHELRPGLKTLFMSGYTPEVVVHRGVIDAGVHFLQKPYSMHDLAISVRSALQG